MDLWCSHKSLVNLGGVEAACFSGAFGSPAWFDVVGILLELVVSFDSLVFDVGVCVVLAVDFAGNYVAALVVGAWM